MCLQVYKHVYLKHPCWQSVTKPVHKFDFVLAFLAGLSSFFWIFLVSVTKITLQAIRSSLNNWAAKTCNSWWFKLLSKWVTRGKKTMEKGLRPILQGLKLIFELFLWLNISVWFKKIGEEAQRPISNPKGEGNKPECNAAAGKGGVWIMTFWIISGTTGNLRFWCH